MELTQRLRCIVYHQGKGKKFQPARILCPLRWARRQVLKCVFVIATASLSFFLAQEDSDYCNGKPSWRSVTYDTSDRADSREAWGSTVSLGWKAGKKRFNSVKMFLFYLTISKFFLLLSLKEEKNPLNQKTKALALISWSPNIFFPLKKVKTFGNFEASLPRLHCVWDITKKNPQCIL